MSGSCHLLRRVCVRLRRSKFAVKESQGLARVLDTLVFAYEFIVLPTPNLQAEGYELLRRTILRLHPDLKVCLAAAQPTCPKPFYSFYCRAAWTAIVDVHICF